MADPSDPKYISPATKTRTIQHMNKDHATDLQHILQHYNKLSASQAAYPQLVDIDLSSLTIVTGDAKTHVVELNPPMDAWNDRRSRLVDMTMTARAALGIETPDSDSDSHDKITITKYTTPGFFDALVGLSVLFFFSSYFAVRTGLLTPTSETYANWLPYTETAYNAIDKVHPGGVAYFSKIVQMIFYPVLGIHLAEALVMDLTRLSKYGVKRFTLLWGKWVVSTFFEGYMAFMRIDGVIEGLKAKNAKTH
ncbi:Protein of unknown function (DUF2470) domain containing protein [Naviculisporaceae sp. PSN 640]